MFAHWILDKSKEYDHCNRGKRSEKACTKTLRSIVHTWNVLYFSLHHILNEMKWEVAQEKLKEFILRIHEVLTYSESLKDFRFNVILYSVHLWYDHTISKQVEVGKAVI